MNFNVGGIQGGSGQESQPLPTPRQYLSTSSPAIPSGAVTSSAQGAPRPTFLVSTALPEGLIGLVREGLVPQQGTPLPDAIVQITQPLARVALSEGVTLVRSVPMTTNGGSVTIRSTPISIPAPKTSVHHQQHIVQGGNVSLSRHSSSTSSLLADDISDTDYITLSSSHHTSMVFSTSPLSAHGQDRSSSQGRGRERL